MTCPRAPRVVDRGMLNSVSAAFIDQLHGLLPDAAFRDPSAGYLEEPRGVFSGVPGLVLAPASAREVSVILKGATKPASALSPMVGEPALSGAKSCPMVRPRSSCRSNE